MKYLCFFILFSLVGCNDQGCTRRWGGTTKVSLEPGQKLVNLTWKEDSLWVLVRKADESEAPQRYIFQEHSPYGMVEGNVLVEEVAAGED